MGRSVLLYAVPKRGKTFAALTAYPNALVLTPSVATAAPIAKSLGLDMGKRIKRVTSLGQVAGYVKKLGGQVPIILDDLSVLMQQYVDARKDDGWEVYTDVAKMFEDLMYDTIPNVENNVVATLWEQGHETETRVDGKVMITMGCPMLPGKKFPAEAPGKVDFLCRVEPMDMPEAKRWPYQIRLHSDPFYITGGRSDTILPATMRSFRAMMAASCGGVPELVPGYNDLVGKFEAGEELPREIARAARESMTLATVVVARDEALSRKALVDSEDDLF